MRIRNVTEPEYSKKRIKELRNKKILTEYDKSDLELCREIIKRCEEGNK